MCVRVHGPASPAQNGGRNRRDKPQMVSYSRFVRMLDESAHGRPQFLRKIREYALIRF